jgi:hypothetical protein
MAGRQLVLASLRTDARVIPPEYLSFDRFARPGRIHPQQSLLVAFDQRRRICTSSSWTVAGNTRARPVVIDRSIPFANGHTACPCAQRTGRGSRQRHCGNRSPPIEFGSSHSQASETLKPGATRQTAWRDRPTAEAVCRLTSGTRFRDPLRVCKRWRARRCRHWPARQAPPGLRLSLATGARPPIPTALGVDLGFAPLFSVPDGQSRIPIVERARRRSSAHHIQLRSPPPGADWSMAVNRGSECVISGIEQPAAKAGAACALFVSGRIASGRGRKPWRIPTNISRAELGLGVLWLTSKPTLWQ